MSKRRREKRQALALQAAANPLPLRLECDAAVEFIAAKDDGSGKPKLPTFKQKVYTGGKMRPRGFRIPVVADLATFSVASGTRPMFLGHDPTQIVGHGEVNIGQTDITAEGILSGAGKAAEEVRISAGNGFPWKASMGADPTDRGELEFVEAGKQVTVNGRKFNGPLYVARHYEIHETSFVSLAGDNRSSASVAASLGAEPMNEFQKWLQAKGFDEATLTDDQKAALKAAFDIAQKAPPATDTETVNAGGSTPEEIAALRAEMAAENKRIKAIRTLCAAHPTLEFKANDTDAGVDLESHAIAEGWTAEATELYALRAKRPAAAIHSRNGRDDATLQALQGAMVLRAGQELDNKFFLTQQAQAMKLPAWIRAGLNTDQRQKAMEAAWRFRDLSMYDIALHAIRLDGKDVPSGSREEVIQAAFSGSSLTNIFTTNVNTVILATYMEAGDTTGGWVSEADVADFKSNERPRMVKGPNLAKLPPGQTADHVTRSDLVETYKVYRYAKQFVVDEQDFINDSFGAMQDTPREMGLAAARLRPDLVYYILMSNPALGADSVAIFHADHTNLNTSATFSATTLKTAIRYIELQRENSINLNLKASHLIVPPALKHLAAELITSSTILYGGDDEAIRGTTNTLRSEENLSLVVDARLENGVTDPLSGTTSSGSATTWFMASRMGHTIEVGYRRGTGRAPSVRSFTLDQGQWGMGWDVKHDIGAKALDYRGLSKNTA